MEMAMWMLSWFVLGLILGEWSKHWTYRTELEGNRRIVRVRLWPTWRVLFAACDRQDNGVSYFVNPLEWQLRLCRRSYIGISST